MSPLPNKTRLYEALGQIVVSFKTLEQGVDGLILACMKSPATEGKTILIDQIPFAHRVSSVSELVRELHREYELGALNQTLAALVERCVSCEQQRNNWIRSYWVPEVESAVGTVMRLRRSGDTYGVRLEPVDIVELENFIVVLNATVAYLYGFHQKLAVNFKRIEGVQHHEIFLKTPRLLDGLGGSN
ncbi:hypothetical protein [Cellvibrio fibrivorans]|jgi:hypothetical protein|uniref:Uncharacterized protein n=1 Tax=Cellvibrio fibrivorans TaxID=126350 RepID=A0ABU1UWU3_9GAMM|nr:hypothetical protein [Cellvibrio fibrivorans]MDR7089635.1 hypothetical protein [Cellvibrio fibrivorans]